MEKYCLCCGKPLKIKITRDITRKKYCSRVCLAKHRFAPYLHQKKSEEHKRKISETRKRLNLAIGERNPRYIDGRSIFRKRLLASGIPQKCFKCESTVNLIAHHVEPCERENTKGRKILNGNHDVSNGIWICSSCHKKHHASSFTS